MAGCLLFDPRSVCFCPGLIFTKDRLQLGEISHNGFVVKDICHLWLPVWRTVQTQYQAYLAQLAVKSINFSRYFIIAWKPERQTKSVLLLGANVLYSCYEKSACSAGKISRLSRAYILSIYALERKVEEWKNSCLQGC